MTVSPELVRHVIGEELRRPVTGPLDSSGAISGPMLVVSLGADSVSMEMRAGGGAVIRRRIQPTGQGDPGLRVVSWLAGNLARDEAREILDARPPIRTSSARTVAVNDAVDEPHALQTSATTQPPAMPPPDVPTVAATAAPVGEATYSGRPWRVGVAMGKRLSFQFGDHYINRDFEPGTTSRVELLARSQPDRWSWTGALDLSDWNDAHGGQEYMVSVGRQRRIPLTSRWWAVDLSCGGGLALFHGLVPVPVLGSSPQAYTESYEMIGPRLAVQGSAALVVTGWDFGEMVLGARLDEFSNFLRMPRLIVTGGLRMNL